MEHSQHQRAGGTGNFIPGLGQQQRPNPSSHSHSSSLPNLESKGHQDHSPAAQDCPPCCSSRDAFRQLTRDILHLTVQSTKEAGIPVNSLEPKKFNPSEAMDVPLAYDSHSSYGGASDYHEGSGRQSVWPGPLESEARAQREPSPPKAYSYPADASQHGRRIPQSKSDGNVKSFDYGGCDGSDPANYYQGWEGPARVPPTEKWQTGNQHHEQRHESTHVLRGRGRGRSRSPTKLEDLDEDTALDLYPRQRRSKSPHKKLFGENGWLGRSPDINDVPGEKKKPGLRALGEKIKQRVEDITGSASSTFQPKMLARSTCPISLDPPTQAKLYSEMELMICVTANQFLISQYQAGHMSAESVNKVTNFWVSKSRPQVVQFQFDQATQRDLIIYNLRTFKFHGECAFNTVVLNATLYNWKAMAKEMSIRTFCYPDSVIRKHMHDTHKILEMLGGPLVTFLAFQELQMGALAAMKKAQEKQLKESAEKHATQGASHPSAFGKRMA
ncbi:hypothetical protein McanMca71_001736 [Microsporum canis]|uniref:Uncharacterized protein n=1 Tax=Arthroderma otae (strain ATCC MYA-4605 / CBS 113480) TaxID=554155 RepID=C5FXN5_ARTOC|nr:conserved hypothetical protein [Microsporum canis CBS 113480]EEQ35075.1 conserved hypothetical protein [Microsporum canis CBS 113480]